jgi:hypothetical protein
LKLVEFTKEGLLPAVDYEMTFSELRKSILVHAPSAHYPQWDSKWRANLVDNLEILTGQLWQVGIVDIFINGSFVEDKDHPNDIDGYFVCELEDLTTGRLTRELNLLDTFEIWTWDPASRRAYRGYPKKQLPMWHQYRVELYPHFGQLSGIRDKYGNELEFPSAFRLSRRDGQPKGIVKLKQGDKP